MIQLKNISKVYRVGKSDFYALKDVSLRIEKGELVAICGASGSGKSTLLNIIGCLDNPSTGTCLLGGKDVGGCSDEEKAGLRNRKIGFVLQDFALLEGQQVLYNVMLPLLLGKTPYRKIREKALRALDRVGLADQSKKRVNQLSGGQKQRVAIARAMVIEPELLLADEPTGQLDSQTGMAVMELFRQLNRQGMTVVVVTHNDEIAACADRTICLRDGKVVEDCG